MPIIILRRVAWSYVDDQTHIAYRQWEIEVGGVRGIYTQKEITELMNAMPVTN